jgi:hypothetical protein
VTSSAGAGDRLGSVIDDPQQPDDTLVADEFEVVDAVPVVSRVRTLEPRLPRPLVVQAAAVAASGFVAGAATAAVVRHRRVKKAAKRRGHLAAGVVASRSFLIDVHLLGSRD